MEKTGDVAGGWEVTWKGLVMWEAMEASGPKMGGGGQGRRQGQRK